MNEKRSELDFYNCRKTFSTTFATRLPGNRQQPFTIQRKRVCDILGSTCINGSSREPGNSILSGRGDDRVRCLGIEASFTLVWRWEGRNALFHPVGNLCTLWTSSPLSLRLCSSFLLALQSSFSSSCSSLAGIRSPPRASRNISTHSCASVRFGSSCRP